MNRRVIIIGLLSSLVLGSPAIAAKRNKSAQATRRRKTKSSGSQSASSYRSCAAAREAGVAPLRRGDSGYSRNLDRDGDGIACE